MAIAIWFNFSRDEVRNLLAFAIGIDLLQGAEEAKQHNTLKMLNSESKEEEKVELKQAKVEKIIHIQTRQATRNLLWYCIGLSVILLLLLLMPNIFNSHKSFLSTLNSDSAFPPERHIFKLPDIANSDNNDNNDNNDHNDVTQNDESNKN